MGFIPIALGWCLRLNEGARAPLVPVDADLWSGSMRPIAVGTHIHAGCKHGAPNTDDLRVIGVTVHYARPTRPQACSLQAMACATLSTGPNGNHPLAARIVLCRICSFFYEGLSAVALQALQASCPASPCPGRRGAGSRPSESCLERKHLRIWLESEDDCYRLNCPWKRRILRGTALWLLWQRVLER